MSESEQDERQKLAALESAVALLIEELNSYLAEFGSAWLESKKVPQEAKAHARNTAARVWPAVMKQPELGIHVKGYNELLGIVQKALAIDIASLE